MAEQEILETVIPAKANRPHWKWNMTDGPALVKGDTIKIIVKVNMVEVVSMKHVIREDITPGLELRPQIVYMPLEIAEMVTDLAIEK